MTDTPTEKTCTGCGETKPLGEYGAQKKGKYGRTARCKACINARNRERYWRDPEAARKYSREYAKEWHGRNPGWRTERAHFSWKGSYKERTARLGLEPVIEDFTRADVIEEYGDECWHCKEAPFEELDHFPVPVRKGGHHKLSNVRPSCARCNVRGRPSAAERELGQERAAA